MEDIRSIFEIEKNLIGQWVGYYNNLDTNMETLKRMTEQLIGRENDINEELKRSTKIRRVEVKLWQEDVRRIIADVQTLERQEKEVRGLKNALKRATLGEHVVYKIEEVGKLYENGEFSNGLLIDDPMCGHAIPTAESLAETSPQFMVQAGEGSKRVPHKDWSKDLERVSLMRYKIVELPFERPIPHLTTLMRMLCLTKLDLSYTAIESLPNSISMLENLHQLSLRGCCKLKYVPSLEKLKALKHFVLTESQIEEVPQGIGKLVHLRMLGLSRNYKLDMSPCFHYLGIQATKVEVSKQLIVPRAEFHNVQELTKYVKSVRCKSLERDNLAVRIVGKNNQYKEEKEVILTTEVDAAVLPSNIEDLRIRRWDNHVSLSDIQSLRDARGLRKFPIEVCDGLEPIVSSSSSSSCFSEDYHIPLTMIKELSFVKLPKFRGLFDIVIPPHNISFMLKRLEFWGCPRIKNIFPAKLLQNFPNLEELKVLDCENVEEIIVEVETSDRGEGHHEDDGNTITLRNLKILHLESLPRLKSIYKGIMVCESLQIIQIWLCPMLRRLPISLHMNEDGEQASAPPALQHILREEEWWESQEWDNPLTKPTLQPFPCYYSGLMELQSDQGEENAIMELQSDQGEENAIVYDIIPNKHHQDAKLLSEEELNVFATKVPMQKPQYEATLGISDLLGKDESIIATGRRGGLSVDLDPLDNERKIVGLRLGVALIMALFSRKEFITKMTDKLPHSPGKESSETILLAGKELEDAALLFFHDMSALCVLDLSYTSVNSLPQSISRLKALQKLILRGCDFLMELPPEIGELTNLEVIDLEGTEIIYLPKEIAKLIQLSCLKMSFYRYANNYQESKHIDTIIPSASLSNLSRLNELSIDVNPDGDWWDVEVKTIIHDLCSLRELRTLKLYLPTIELLEELIRDSPSLICPALTHFRFIVGRQVERFLSRLPLEVEEEFNNLEKSEKGLKYVNGEGIPIEIIEVLKHANSFFLEHHWTVNNLSEFGLQNMDKLKFCFLVECNELRTIIDAKQFYQGDCEGDDSNESEQYSYFNEEMMLGSLQYLSIHYMKNMESICQGSVGKGCLSNLKFLALHTCLSLTTIFTVGMLRNLVNLEELIVEDCTKISSLVDLKNSDSKSGHFLPSLKKILLLELPKLVSISNGLCIAPKLERMVIFYCPKLIKLSIMEVSSKDLKVIKGENEWWGALKWHESDLSSDHQDYLASVFVPLRRDGDLMTQFTKD